ncbi:MAG: hypothetical protein QG662_139 [Pseudomonadota bacterium]|nr:hypothetical protein [Pseudomonadota bacterium]
MKYLRAIAAAGFLLVSTNSSAVSDYADFSRDLAAPYGQYRLSLALTGNKDNVDKALVAMDRFIAGWEGLARRYAADPPAPFAGIADFPEKMNRPIAIGREAISLLKDGEVARAHLVLEEVRYLLWGMRIQARINSIADKANDFHEAMEVVFDRAAAAKNAGELAAVRHRYGAWLSIKWEEQALAGDLEPIRTEFEAALAEGRMAIAAYLEALRGGDADAARKLAGGVKNAYKKIWGLDPK